MNKLQKKEKLSTIHNPSMGIVLVTYGNEDTIEGLLNSIGKEKQPNDYVVLLDNHPKQLCADIAENSSTVNRVVRSEDNLGFAVGCNRAAALLPESIELILFLNPDTNPKPGALNELRKGGIDDWAGWMGLLTLPGDKVNSAGNVVHVSGLSWCAGYEEPTSLHTKPVEVNVLSGACTVVRKSVWDEMGGFAELYFMYYEDTDLSLRMCMAGHRLGLVPSAHIEHDYIFSKSTLKWFYLERNRYVFMLRLWPASTLLLLLPLLIPVEVGLLAVSILQRRFLLKLRSTASFLGVLPQVIQERREIKRQREVTTRQFFDMLQPELSSPLLGNLGKSKAINIVFKSYYKQAKRMLSDF